VLVAPISELNLGAITQSVVPALGAALLARFTSFGIACVAGLGMGIIQSLTTYLETKPWFPTTHGAAWPGVPELIFFVVITSQVSLAQLALAGVAGLVLSKLAVHVGIAFPFGPVLAVTRQRSACSPRSRRCAYAASAWRS